MPADVLHRLIYASRQHVETRDLDVHVERILQVSQRNNARDGLTGLLLVHDGWFVQALEGPEVAVQRAYGRIICDRRHYDASMVAGDTVVTRAFPSWSMTARRLPARAGRRLGFDPTRLDGEAALSLLLASLAEGDQLAA